MPPAYVKPYVKRGKTDAADAEAICEAVTRATMRFVPIKSREQQAALLLHRTRSLLVKQLTQLVNMMRGQLAEFGVDIPIGLERALTIARQIVDGEIGTALPTQGVKMLGPVMGQGSKNRHSLVGRGRSVLDAFTPDEYRNFFTASGYEPAQSGRNLAQPSEVSEQPPNFPRSTLFHLNPDRLRGEWDEG